MSEVWKKREVWVFLCSIIVVNSLFVVALNTGVVPFRAYNVGRFLLLGLTLATVVFVFRGFTGLQALVRSLTVWRVNPLWYLLALTWCPLLCTVFLIAKSLLTGTNAFTGVTFGLVTQFGIMRTVVIASFIGEIVWVAYSIATLSKRFGNLGGSLIVGAFWGLWWFPMILLNKGVVPDLPMAQFLGGMLGIATMCGFVYLSSGSGVVVLLLQIMVNTSFLIFPTAPTNGGGLTSLAFAATYLVASLTLFLLFGPRPLFMRPAVAAPVPA